MSTIKCVVYCPYDQPNFITYIAQTPICYSVITHLHIIINWNDIPFTSSITNGISFSEDPIQGLIIPMITQIQTLESQCLEQLLFLQNQGIQLILSIHPYNSTYYGFRTLPTDINSEQPSPNSNPINNQPTLQCYNPSQSESISGLIAYNIVKYFFTSAYTTMSGFTSPVKICYNGADIIDMDYYCATNPSNCSGCCPPDGTYGTYNILQFMYYLRSFGKQVNPNFTLSKLLFNDEDLVSNTTVCNITQNTTVDISLGIIDYGCSFYNLGDPYYDMYSTVIKPNQMILSVDFSQTDQPQSYQTLMQSEFAKNYGGVMLYNLWDCSYANTSGTCNLNVEDILTYWTSTVECSGNWTNTYYVDGKCVECISVIDCPSDKSFCLNNSCVTCTNNYNCSNADIDFPYCWDGDCLSSACPQGYIGPECQCSTDISNCNNNGTPIWDVSNQICVCSCNEGWVGPQCQCNNTGPNGTSPDCSHNGILVWNGTNTEGTCDCSCSDNWYGSVCNTIDYCCDCDNCTWTSPRPVSCEECMYCSQCPSVPHGTCNTSKQGLIVITGNDVPTFSQECNSCC